MATKILKITNIHVIDSDRLVLAGGLLDQNVDASYLNKIIGSVVTITDNTKDLFKIKVLDLQISYSLAGFRDAFVLVENKHTEITLAGCHIVMD